MADSGTKVTPVADEGKELIEGGGMSKNTKIILAVLIGLIVAGGIAVGIYAGVEGFGSSDSDDDDDDDGDSASNECGQCWTPECSASAGSGKCEKSTVTITDQSGSNRFKISTNAYPCHEMRGTNIYASCPVPNSESETFPVPDLCSDGKYHDGGSCGTYNYLTVQPQFSEVGYIGRPPTKSSHWSSKNVPQEAVPYDPLPASCGDVSLKCESSYGGEKRYSLFDVQRIEDAGTDVYNDLGESLDLPIDSQNAHDQPPKGLYHYHANPAWDTGAYADYVIGYALDGVPFMGLGSKLTSGSSPSSSYALKSGHDGRYHMDYEYITGRGNLDEFNGAYATIDEKSTYAYFATSTYPYLFRNFHGDH